MKAYPKLAPKYLIWTMVVFALYAVIVHDYNGWDFKNYHWYNAYAFLHHRLRWDIAPAQMQTYFNPVLDTFNYLVVKLLHFRILFQAFFGALYGLIAYFVLKIAIRFLYDVPQSLRRTAIACAVVIGVTDPALLSQIGLGFVDPEVGLLIVIAFYWILRAIDAAEYKVSIAYLLLAGLITGLAVGLKLTAASFALALMLAYLLAHKFSFKKLWAFCLFGLCALLCFLAVSGPWMLVLWHSFADPFFPFFNDIFHSPYAAWQSYAQASGRFFPQTTMQWICYPFYWLKTNTLVTESPMRNWRLAVLIVLFLLCAIKWLFGAKQKGSAVGRYFFWFMVLSYLLWLKEFALYRYFVPIPVLSGIGIVLALLYLLKDQGEAFQKRMLLGITLVLLATTIYPHWGKVRTIEVTVPNIPKNAYVIMSATNIPQGYLVPFFPASIRFINPESNLMGLGASNLLAKEADQLIELYQGPLFVIDYPHSDVASLLNYYHLQELSTTCLPIISSLEKQSLQLCRVSHIY